MFGLIAGTETDIDTHLARLRQSGGRGRMAFDLQDPRYKDRSLAAYNIATMIPNVKDAKERQRISEELVDVLSHQVADSEESLQVYLLLAVGQLGQKGGLKALLARMESRSPRVRQGAVGGILSWPDRQAARVTVPALIEALNDADALVVAEASAALGELAETNDESATAALRDVLERGSSDMRDAAWNAALALARLGDEKAARIVAGVLLDRDALVEVAQLKRGMQDRVILSALSVADDMTDPKIWDKIRRLAADDPNLRVRSQALNLLARRDKDASG